MIVICDTSALSVLAETRLLPILPALVGQVTITQSIHEECRNAGAPLELRLWIEDASSWLLIVPDPAFLLTETSSLGSGEASAITLAWQHRRDSQLILDEKRGRKIAVALGLPVIGVLALVAQAAKAGMVNFEESIQSLKAAGFWVSESLIETARQKARGTIT